MQFTGTSFECVSLFVCLHTHTYVALILHPKCVPEKVGVGQKGLYQTQHSKK
jgi:hypothetical protein